MANKNTTNYTNSPLVSVTYRSPNHSGQRTHAIDRITPHCVVGQASAEVIGSIFKPTTRQASCNYGIGKDGRVVLVVDEKNRSWCSSSWENDQRAITIEVASDSTHPYAFNEAAYNSLIELCADICKRNEKKKLLWIADKAKLLAYIPAADEMVLTVHRWFSNKSCPGDWMYERMGDLAEKVTKKLNTVTTVEPEKAEAEKKPEPFKPYLVRVKIPDLNYRKGPGVSYPTYGYIPKGIYTIVEEQNGWGLLKGYAKFRNGWISLKYVEKI